MGVSCGSPNNDERYYNQFICKIEFGKYKVSGFLCNLNYSDQEEFVHAIITYQDLFIENFKFIENSEYNIEKYDSTQFSANLKILFISDNSNIVIFQMLSYTPFLKKLNPNIDIHFSFIKSNKSILTIKGNNYYNKGYKLFTLLNKKNKIFDCLIRYKKDEKDYFFEYYGIKNNNKVFEEGLVLNKSKSIIGITMDKKNKGILVNRIIQEIQEYQKNKKNDNKPKQKSKENSNNNLCLFKNKRTFLNENNSNNLNNNEKTIIIINKKEVNKSNTNNVPINKEVTKKESIKITKFESKGKESDKGKKSDKGKESEKEINLYFLFNNGKELYLDVKETCSFKEVIKQLNEKYLWLKNISIKEYQFKKKIISKYTTVKDNKLEDNSTINIIEKP